MSDYLTIVNTNEMLRISAESLVYVDSFGNYSDIHTHDGEKCTVTLQLGNIEELIHRQFKSNDIKFVRIGKSLIINLNYLHYLNPSKRQMVLSDNSTFKVSLEASKEALRQLKRLIETELNTL